jgi:hypothetical protein
MHVIKNRLMQKQLSLNHFSFIKSHLKLSIHNYACCFTLVVTLGIFQQGIPEYQNSWF